MMEKNRKDCQATWQDYFAQHGYLEQTAGWQLALEGLLGEALMPVAFPEKHPGRR